MSPEVLVHTLLVVVGFVLSTAVHEWAHAWAATRLGDPTPKSQGRLTLDPTAHIDPLGTLLFPALGAVTGGFLFGWARPVEFRPGLFRRDVTMRRGTMLVAAAGPLSNLALGLVCALLLAGLGLFAGSEGATGGTIDALALLLRVGVTINVVLLFFNLLPVAPLDGFRVLEATLGTDHPTVRFIEQNRFLLFLAVILIGWRLIAPLVAVTERALMQVASLG